ncbi:hypothetical protein V1504DRAFT_442872 [Lipomyces starkeyi]
MKTKGKTPTPSDGSTSSRSRNLKQNLLDRDGWLCAVGRVMDLSAPWPMIPNQDYDHLEVAHIIPFSAISGSSFRTMLSRFASQDICDLLTGQSINDPFNALLLDAKTHKFFIQFNLQSQHALRSPLLCNLHLAVGLAVEAIDKIPQDEDQFNMGASYLQRK